MIDMRTKKVLYSGNVLDSGSADPGRLLLYRISQGFVAVFTIGSVGGMFALILLQGTMPLLLAYIAMALLCCIIIFILLRSRRRTVPVEFVHELIETRNHVQQIQLQKRQEQLNALQSQINPHFLFNTLDTIRGLAIEKNSPEIADIVGSLASMFKYTMDYDSTRVTVADELSHLERFLQVQSMRFPGKYSFTQIYECPYDTLYKVSIPKLTLQPIVENAISHGLKARSSGGIITIRYILSDMEFSIIISDNGMGIPEDMVVMLNQSFRLNDAGPERNESSTLGIALANIDMRIKFFFGESYGLYIASTPGLGTDVTIRLPAPENEP